MTAFGWQVHAEWTKFRTVHGWVIAVLIAVLATVGLGMISGSACGGGGCGSPPTGPGGGAVQDAFSFAHQAVTGDGTITVRLTSFTGRYTPAHAEVSSSGPPAAAGLMPWSKTGIIIKASTAPGSAYAAMVATGGHGIRMQWDFTHDVAGQAGSVTASSPRWLRLTRSGDSITGYDSLDGTHWAAVGSVVVPGLPATVQAGLFAASPNNLVPLTSGIGGDSGSITPTQATGVFDHIGLSWPSGTWTGDQVGGQGNYGPPMSGSTQVAGSAGTVTGSGDIAPEIAGADVDGAGPGIRGTLVGTFAGVLVLVVVAAMFVTAEYRRGLIRTTFTASTSRIRVLAAKASVVGAVGFVAGLVAIGVALPVGASRLRADGNPVLPVPLSTEVRVVIGTGLLVGVAAVLGLAIGTSIRRSAVAIAAVIVAVFIPYLIATVPNLLPAGAQDWLLRLTPAAGFAIQQAYPRYYQVNVVYRPADGYYPLAPWAGFAVECAWAVAALVLAGYLLRRRDA